MSPWLRSEDGTGKGAGVQPDALFLRCWAERKDPLAARFYRFGGVCSRLPGPKGNSGEDITSNRKTGEQLAVAVTWISVMICGQTSSWISSGVFVVVNSIILFALVQEARGRIRQFYSENQYPDGLRPARSKSPKASEFTGYSLRCQMTDRLSRFLASEADR
jgi:hypothetical protein